MHAAPPVQAPARNDGLWLRIQQVLFALAVSVPLVWAGSRLGLAGSGPAAGAAAAGLASALAAGRVLRRPRQVLAWDGAAWRLFAASGGGCGGCARLMIDLGPWMLVRFVPPPPSAPQWLALSRRDAAGAWEALRVALYAHASPPAAAAAAAE